MTNDNELTPPSPNKIPYVMEAHGEQVQTVQTLEAIITSGLQAGVYY